MNKVMLMGRLTRDPEVRYSTGNNGNQSVFAHFTIAVDRRFKREGQADADFFNCTAFGKQAEFTEKYLKKGMKMVVCGSIQNDNYTDNNGVQRYAVQIMVDEMEFAESKAAQNNNQNDGGYAAGNTGNGGFNGNGNAGYNGNPNNGNGRGNNGSYNGNTNGGNRNNGSHNNGAFNNGNRGGAFNNGGYAGNGFINIPDGLDDEDLPFN